VIERLGPGDGPRLRAVRLRALADAPEAFGTTLVEAEAWGDARWEGQAVSLPTFVWVDHGADLGMVRVAPHDDDAEAAYLISMWVAPEARGRGVGDMLVAEVLGWARAHGRRRVFLDVGERNGPARALYERAGFVVSGVRGALPEPRERVCEVQMRCDLDP